jgi:hypothetical protein
MDERTLHRFSASAARALASHTGGDEVRFRMDALLITVRNRI